MRMSWSDISSRICGGKQKDRILYFTSSQLIAECNENKHELSNTSFIYDFDAKWKILIALYQVGDTRIPLPRKSLEHPQKLSIAKLDFVQVCGLSLNFYNNTLHRFYKIQRQSADLNKSNFAIGGFTNQQTIWPASNAQKNVLSWSILLYPESLILREQSCRGYLIFFNSDTWQPSHASLICDQFTTFIRNMFDHGFKHGIYVQNWLLKLDKLYFESPCSIHITDIGESLGAK